MSDDGADEAATKREGVGSLHKDVPGLDRGSVVGRYVLDVIGQGGIATTEAEVLGASGKLAESRADFDAVLALEDKLKSPELGTTLASRAELELADHKWAAAAQFEERAITFYEASGGPEHLSLWKPLAGLAQARRGLDRKADVKPLLDRAIAIGLKAQISAEDMNPIRDALAKL